MQLNEVLNRDIPYEVVMDTDKKFFTTARIGGRQIVVRCTGMNVFDNSVWAVMFSEIMDDGAETFRATGNGNELEVFSVVVNTMRALVQKHEPDYIRFTASKTESKIGNKRADLYARLAQRFTLPGYTLNRNEQETESVFELKRNDADERAAKARADRDAGQSEAERRMAEFFRRRREAASNQAGIVGN